MNKPTLFFSHSPKDKDAVLAIKNKLDKITGGVMDIFMSSDGQSIPFGTNWIHKVEEGLKAAKIMFVFVTENSISSGWIYFEAGYAYSKGIQVIPVGIGVDIGSLKAPLNLLQGFNVSSEDSLNNFITIINRTFAYHFSGAFEYNDYLEVVRKISPAVLNTIEFEKIVDKIEMEIYDEQTTADGKKVTYDINDFFERIVEYLKDKNISFSREDEYHNRGTTCLVTNGIKILYRKKNEKVNDKYRSIDDCGQISFYISNYKFVEAFTLWNDIMKLLEDKQNNYVWLHLNKKYSYIANAEDGSAIILGHDEFRVDQTNIGGYVCEELDVTFYIFDCHGFCRNKEPEYVASVVFGNDEVSAEKIVKLINKLYDIGLIYEK